MRAIILFLTILLSTFPIHAEKPDTFGRIPIQHEGRIKPLDTFARIYLLAVHGKSSLPEMSASEWLLELLTEPNKSFARPIFKIRNPEVVQTLKLEPREKRLYSFDELAEAFGPHTELLRELYAKSSEERTLVENQLVETYVVGLRVMELGRGVSCLTPDFQVENPELAGQFKLEPGQKVGYRYFLNHVPVFSKGMKGFRGKDSQSYTESEKELGRLAGILNLRQRDRTAATFQVIPALEGEQWITPWSLSDGQSLSEEQAALLEHWEAMLAARLSGDTKEAGRMAESVIAKTAAMADFPSQKMQTEWNYNQADWFTRSLVFYIFGFLLLGMGWLVWRKGFHLLAAGSVLVGLICHGTGLWLRMVIMGRPPVSNLYESVIFVGFIAVLTGLLLEAFRRNGLGTFFAAVPGAILHFVGFSYAAEGDTMGMLVAVLDSNFWLATHVVTITIGYGCALVAGLAGHLYLLYRIFRPKAKKQMAGLGRNLLGLTLVALFFSMFGTILGGIWADQSWGRFCGWDPKENGALLIVMWLLFLMHGRMAGMFKMNGFAAGLVIGNIVVALAWFGVNLLNVGLHSYGFTDSIAMNLAIFCGGELLFVLICTPLAMWRTSSSRKRRPKPKKKPLLVPANHSV